MGMCSGVWGPRGQRPQILEFLGESPAAGLEESIPCCLPEGWSRAQAAPADGGGCQVRCGLRCPCLDLLPWGSGIPGSSRVTQRDSFCLLRTLSSGKKGALF